MKPQIPWLRVFVEGVVIVGSILLAFGIDAWWEGRQDAELEAVVLASVAAEAVQNQTALRDHLDLVGAMSDRTDRFLRSDPATLAALPPDSMPPFLEALQRPQTFDALTAAASLLSQTPVLSSEGVEIRGLVSQFLKEIDDAVEESKEFREASRDVRNRLSAYASRASSAGAGSIGEMVGRLGPAVLGELRADEELVRLVILRTTILTFYMFDLARLETAIDSLAETLQVDLRRP